jgi:hypothetical protein
LPYRDKSLIGEDQVILVNTAYISFIYNQRPVSLLKYYVMLQHLVGKGLVITYPFETAYKGTYEYTLAKAKSSPYFLPLNNNAAHQTASAWLDMPLKHLDLAYIYSEDDDYKFYGNLNSVFDGIVFCRNTSAADSYLKKK